MKKRSIVQTHHVQSINIWFHLLKRNEHRNRLKDHISCGAVQWGRNNARPGTGRKRAAILHGMEVGGVSHQFVRLSEGLQRGGVLGGWMGMHTHTSQGTGWSDGS